MNGLEKIKRQSLPESIHKAATIDDLYEGDNFGRLQE